MRFDFKEASERLALLSFITACVFAPSVHGVTLAWDPSPDTNVTGYALYYGTNSGSYATRVDVGNQTNSIVQVATNGSTYFFVATAYTIEGIESLPSNEVSYTPLPTGTNQSISFGVLAAKTYGNAAFPLSATASSGLPVSYSSGNTGVATVSGNTVTIVGAGSAVITATQSGNGNYAAAAPVAQTLTVNKAAATISLTGVSATYDGTVKSVSATTTPGGLPVAITYNGSGSAPAAVGSYAVVATVNSANYTGSASGTLTINKAGAVVTLSGLTAVYDGTPKPVSVSTTPAGLAVGVTYNGSSSAPVNVGSYAVLAVVNAPNYAGTNSGTLVIAAATNLTQTITFAALPAKTYGDATFPLSATASSGLPVSYSSGSPGVATVSGSTVTIVGAGSAVITATQSGNGNYAAAAPVAQTLVVNKAAATISLTGLSATYDGTVKSVSATTTPGGLPVTVTYNGSGSAPVNAGNYAVVALVNSANYLGSNGVTLAIAKANQTINFGALAAQTYGDPAFSLSAVASSGLPVSYSSGNAGVATMAGNTVSVVGAGSVFITAFQAGSGNYHAAPNAAQNLVVNKAAATVSLSGLSATYDGTPKSVSATTTPAGLPVTITYNGSGSAPAAVGSYAVVATVNSANYGGSASRTLVIVDAATPAVLTVNIEGQGTVTPDLNGQAFAPGTNVALSAWPAAGWRLAEWLLEGGGFSTNLTVGVPVNASLTVTARFVDAAAPAVAITSLSTNSGRGGGPTITLAGTAADNAGVAAVEYAVVGGGVTSGYQPANGTTNWTFDLTSPNYGTNLIRVRARDLQGNLSPEVTRGFNYVVLSPFSLSVAGSGSVAPNLNGQPLELGRTYTLTATAGKGYLFERWAGGVTSSNRSVSFAMSVGLSVQAYFRETNAPLVAISSPGSGAKFTNHVASFKGTAADASGVARVEYSLDGLNFQSATGTTNWTATVTLVPGTNVLRLRSVDQAGNVSRLTTRPVFYSVTTPLWLQIEGKGKVSGATNGQWLEIGRAYKLTATPAAGQLFLEWSGHAHSTSNALSFLMQPGLLLEANFVTNAYLVLKGNYQALFQEAEAVQHTRSGLLKLTVTTSGSYSASLKLGAKALSLAGKFDARGQSRLKATLATGNVVEFDLWLDTANLTEQLAGTVSGPGWAAELSGYRTPVYAPGTRPAATGRFTFVIPADDDSTNNPAGLGYGTLTVASTGSGTLAGKLGDGTAFSVAAPLARNGRFPLYAQLYSSSGSVLSWLRCANRELSDFDGALHWSKPANPKNLYYPAGFAVASYCVGSAYNATNAPLLNLTNAPMQFTGGTLGAGFRNLVTLLPGGALTNHSTNKLSFTLTKATGLFTGSVVNPQTGGSLNYSGALFQKWNAALGYTLVGKQSSAVKLTPAEE